MFGAALVEDRQELFGLRGEHLQIDDRVCGVALEAVDNEIALKVSTVQARKRQTETVTWGGDWRLEF